MTRKSLPYRINGRSLRIIDDRNNVIIARRRERTRRCTYVFAWCVRRIIRVEENTFIKQQFYRRVQYRNPAFIENEIALLIEFRFTLSTVVENNKINNNNKTIHENTLRV